MEDIAIMNNVVKIETRSVYTRGELEPAELKPNPFDQFALWFEQAIAAKVVEPNAMSVATAGADQRPLVRTVLLKIYDQRGFVFFTNFESRKARQIAGWLWSARSSCAAPRRKFPPPKAWRILSPARAGANWAPGCRRKARSSRRVRFWSSNGRT